MTTGPYIFVIDIDGCLIGDISPQIMLYETMKDISKSMNLKEFRKKLANGIIRPHFATFYKNIKRHMPDAEFFIYTASEKKWANFLIKNIELAINVKFNRPIFTRNDCFIMNNECKKSLEKIKPVIARSLKKKYGSFSFDNRIVMIDNTNVFSKKEQDMLLLCPTYSSYVLENLPIFLDEIIYNNNRDSINKIFKRYGNIIGHNAETYIEFQKMFYVYYIKKLDQEKKTEDRFWYNLAKIIVTKNITRLSPKAIAYIHKKLQK